MKYDYNKENLKVCPICGHVIDYHIDGFYHDTILNVWICRRHELDTILRVVKLKDKGLIKFIKDNM